MESIQTEFFYHPAHQIIYREILILKAKRIAIDFITLTQVMKDKGCLDQAGGASAISELFTFVPTASNADYYIDIVREKHVLRMLSKATLEIYSECFVYEGSPTDLVERMESAIVTIDQTWNQGAELELGDTKRFLMQFIQEIEDRKKGKSLPYLETHIPVLNDKLEGGFIKGEYILVQGFPGSGKTALALNQVVHVGVTLDKPVVVIEREMKGPRIIHRMIAHLTGIDSKKIHDGKLSQYEIDKVMVATQKIHKSKIHIWDNEREINSNQCLRRCELVRKKYGELWLCVIDYLQILTEGESCETREEEVSKDSKNCKRICDAGTTTMVLTQLNDQGKTRESRAPYQDCDDCFEVQQTDNIHERNLKCKKRRNGGAAGWDFLLGFRGSTQTFHEHSRK